MKTLDQIEARTPLVAGQPGVTIDGATGATTLTARGSYYLTGKLTTTGAASCINIGIHTVSLDLNGFTISRTTGAEADSAGILVPGAVGQKVMIKNGFVVGGGTATGFAFAIKTTASFDGSVHVENVHRSNVRGGINDGISDAFEYAYINGLTSMDATSDFDKDGFSDKAEYLALSNPLSPESFFKATKVQPLASGGTTTALKWTSNRARRYIVETSTDLGKTVGRLVAGRPRHGLRRDATATFCGVAKWHHISRFRIIPPASGQGRIRDLRSV